MAKYIEREALIAEYDRVHVGKPGGARKLMEKAPAVDAVPVVRCKDCKHYEIHKPKVLENCERNGYLIPMKPDDFCSYGERKEGDGNG